MKKRDELQKIKNEMLKYRDMFGGEICPDPNEIYKARSKKQLAALIDRHSGVIEDIAIEAQSSLSRFKRRIGLELL